MSTEQKQEIVEEQEQKKDKTTGGFVCAKEAQGLLDCVTEANYNEVKCAGLLKKLRVCVKSKVSVDSGLNIDGVGGNSFFSLHSCVLVQ